MASAGFLGNTQRGWPKGQFLDEQEAEVLVAAGLPWELLVASLSCRVCVFFAHTHATTSSK